MRFKNFTLFLLMGVFGLFTTNLFAQQDATIDPADIQYWIGEGENQVVVAVSWCSYTETALAWGYRFDGEATVFQALTDIATADGRLAVVGSAPSNVTYMDDLYDLTMCPNPEAQWGDPDYDVPMHSVNGLMGQNAMAAEPIHDGDFVKVGGYACSIMSPDWTSIIWTTEIIPATDPNVTHEEATIDPSEILYWVGEGEKEVVFAVNWNEPNRCLAWGYRFDGESKVLKEVMDDIVAADDRFAYDASMGFVSNLTFTEDEINYGLVGDYFMYNINGVAAMLGYDEQTVVNGDFIKWGDVSCGTEVAPWTYVWEQEVEPVWAPGTGVNENNANTLAMYPNPAVGETFVTLENAGMTTISVYDIQGRMVSTISLIANEGEQVRLSTERMNAGVYFVTVSNEGAVRTAKLVVK